MQTTNIELPKVVTRAESLLARLELRAKEKELVSDRRCRQGGWSRNSRLAKKKRSAQNTTTTTLEQFG